jgi:hypothetical protein
MEFGMGFGFGWGACFDVFFFSFWDTWSPVWALERLDFPGIFSDFFMRYVCWSISEKIVILYFQSVPVT